MIVAAAFTNGVTYLTPRQLAWYFRCCDTTIAEWRQRGVGPACRIHKQKRGHRGTIFTYRVAEVLAFTGGRWPKSGRFLRTEHVAKLLGITPAALRQRRRRGSGPVPIYFESLVRYLPEDCPTDHGELNDDA